MSKKKNHVPSIRSSAAEYLTFVAAVGDADASIEIRYEDENIWLTQKMMATLYDVSVSAINQHLKRLFLDHELDADSVIKHYLITATDGKAYNTKHYSLQAIIAIGFKIENERAVQFRKWANKIVKDYTIQGWTMDEERLKKSGTILDNEFFERQLEKIREIRLSERKFYQKITDIYATSLDYDATASATRRFFAAVQNKMHYAIHGQTAAEVIVDRADYQKDNMGLSTWGVVGVTVSSWKKKEALIAGDFDKLSHLKLSHLKLSHLKLSHLKLSHLKLSHLKLSHLDSIYSLSNICSLSLSKGRGGRS